jgi:golgi-specific brefeldin A-resistance guanine nucleotide exchange factor 1
MHKLVRTVFSRLHSLDPEVEEAKLAAGDDDAEGEVKMSVSTGGPITNDVTNVPEEDATTAQVEVETEPKMEKLEEPVEPRTPPPVPHSECR